MHGVGHERQRDQHREEDRDNFRHEHQGGFLDLGQRLSSETATPTTRPTSISGAETINSVSIASRATSNTSGPVSCSPYAVTPHVFQIGIFRMSS